MKENYIGIKYRMYLNNMAQGSLKFLHHNKSMHILSTRQNGQAHISIHEYKLRT